MLNMMSSIHPVKSWVAALFSYFMVMIIFDFDFSINYLIGLSSCVLFIVVNRHFREAFIDDPVSYITFDGSHMIMGQATWPISAINQIALDAVKDEGYFSLPLNQYSPGVTAGFIFPATKIDDLRAHLKANLSDNLVFIK